MSGAKSILDIGLTIEYLETKGVPVIGFGTDILQINVRDSFRRISIILLLYYNTRK